MAGHVERAYFEHLHLSEIWNSLIFWRTQEEELEGENNINNKCSGTHSATRESQKLQFLLVVLVLVVVEELLF